MIKYRFKTEEEFKRDGLWIDRSGNVQEVSTPSAWNPNGRMNQYIGQEIPKEFHDFCKDKKSFSFEGWRFKPDNYVEYEVSSTESKSKYRFKTKEEFEKEHLWCNIENKPYHWSKEVTYLLGKEISPRFNNAGDAKIGMVFKRAYTTIDGKSWDQSFLSKDYIEITPDSMKKEYSSSPCNEISLTLNSELTNEKTSKPKYRVKTKEEFIKESFWDFENNSIYGESSGFNKYLGAEIPSRFNETCYENQTVYYVFDEGCTLPYYYYTLITEKDTLVNYSKTREKSFKISEDELMYVDAILLTEDDSIIFNI